MTVIDSSCWLEYFSGSENSRFFQDEIESIHEVIVPTIILYEVFKKIVLEAGEDKALKVIAHMQLGKVVDVDSFIAISASRLSIRYKIPMADSIILASARRYDATLYTQDSHFSSIENVRYFPK